MDDFFVKRLQALLIILSALILPIHLAWAFDEFDTQHAKPRFALSFEDLTLEIKGRARIGLHDLSGKGGPEYDSPTDAATIGTRSPFVDLDSFDLAFRLNWNEMIWFNTNIAFTTSDTSLSAIYFEYKQDLNDWFSHGAELGYQNPLFATHRHTIRYPLIATQYWKNPEYHLAYGARFQLEENTAIAIYLAASFMRPLKSEPIHGSYQYAGSLKTLSYSSAKPFSGNSAAGSALLRLSSYGLSLEGVVQFGNIVTKDGINTLISDFIYYRSLPDFDPNQTSTMAWWAGARLAYNGYGVHIMGEFLASKEQLIERMGMYIQASYTYKREAKFLNEFEILARYEQTWLSNSTNPIDDTHALRSQDTNNAISWDHKIITIAGKAHILDDILAIRLEYSFFLEDNGVPKLNIPNKSFDDDELLILIEARY